MVTLAWARKEGRRRSGLEERSVVGREVRRRG